MALPVLQVEWPGDMWRSSFLILRKGRPYCKTDLSDDFKRDAARQITERGSTIGTPVVSLSRIFPEAALELLTGITKKDVRAPFFVLGFWLGR